MFKKITQAIEKHIERKIQGIIQTKGVYLGQGINLLTSKKEPVFIPWNVLNRHVYLLGATGSGKTTLLRNLAYQIASQGGGVFFLDMKGGETAEKVIRDLYLACLKSNRPEAFVFISPVSLFDIPSARWNPLFYGDAGVVANKLYDAFRSLSENAKFYEDVKFDVLLKLVSAIKKTKQSFTFSTIVQALRSPDHLRALAKICGGTEGESLIDLANEWEMNKLQFIKNIKGTVVSLQLMSLSFPAKIVETITPTFVFTEAIEKNLVVYCLLPACWQKKA